MLIAGRRRACRLGVFSAPTDGTSAEALERCWSRRSSLHHRMNCLDVYLDPVSEQSWRACVVDDVARVRAVDLTLEPPVRRLVKVSPGRMDGGVHGWSL